MTATVDKPKANKPLGGKAYGSIPHLPTSRLGKGDHHCSHGQARIATKEVRDAKDTVIVQEKLDGSCVAAARVGGDILALTRAGYLATTSPYEQHHRWAEWVEKNRGRLLSLLADGERVCGEWLLQAHGTRYALEHEPFVAFDLMAGGVRATYAEQKDRLFGNFVMPSVIGYWPMTPAAALEWIDQLGPGHGSLDPVEGFVWRVERAGKVDFLAKYVRPDKQDGKYLPEISGTGPVWNTYR